MELGRIREVVFDGVSGTQDFSIFATDDGTNQVDLDLKGETGRESINIDFVGSDAFGFQENLVMLLVSEADEFVLDTGTIPGADPFDDTRVHRRLVEIGDDELASPLSGPRQVTG